MKAPICGALPMRLAGLCVFDVSSGCFMRAWAMCARCTGVVGGVADVPGHLSVALWCVGSSAASAWLMQEQLQVCWVKGLVVGPGGCCETRLHVCQHVSSSRTVYALSVTGLQSCLGWSGAW